MHFWISEAILFLRNRMDDLDAMPVLSVFSIAVLDVICRKQSVLVCVGNRLARFRAAQWQT